MTMHPNPTLEALNIKQSNNLLSLI